MTGNKKTIGILGGMGPEASAHIYHQIISLAQTEYSAVQDTDYSPMIIYNLPVHGFDETGIVDDEKVMTQLVGGVKKLEEAGADFIIVACNTVHLFQKEMQDAISIPFVSMIDEVVEAIQKEGYKKISLLSSETTKKTHLYQKAFEKAGIEFLTPDEDQQNQITEIILHVMGGTQTENDKKTLLSIMNKLKNQGAEATILGCTELPLAITQADTDFPLMDAMHVISKKALHEAIIK